MGVPQNLEKIINIVIRNLPFDSAISTLAIHPKEAKSIYQRDICTHMFTAALFTIAKIR
jgi:hypothetical protein